MPKRRRRRDLDATFDHARRRAEERYGLDLKRREWERLNRRILRARHAHVEGFVMVGDEPGSLQTVWRVADFLGETVLVTWCHQR